MSAFNPPKSTPLESEQPPNLFYRGASMLGTFQPGDKLVIEEVEFVRIKKGDLIIFRRKTIEKSDFVVHRVAGITPKGLITRGDNCMHQDKDPVRKENIAGRVIQYDRKGKPHHVFNGRLGQIQAAILHYRLHEIRLIKFLLKKTYAKLRQTGFIARFWKPDIVAVHFETPNGPLVKVMHKGKTVAIHWKKNDRWLIKRPYDIVLQPNYEFANFSINQESSPDPTV